jgi:membrane-associated phospholipid phosphatase
MDSISFAPRARNRLSASIMAAALGILALAGIAEAKDASDYVDDAKNYVLAPLHWDEHDWAWFAGTVAAVAAAHHYDDNVRAHFHPRAFDGGNSHTLRDIAPAAALTGAVVLQGIFGDATARSTGFDMIESAVFAGGTSYALKYATGRERPNQTLDSSRWFHGGDSFPSTHVSVAFAVATSFAERDCDNQWARRVVAYGLAGATAYIRVKDNQHWLSDTIAGAAVGVSTGLFVNHRGLGTVRSASNWSLGQVGDGVGIVYVHELR